MSNTRDRISQDFSRLTEGFVGLASSLRDEAGQAVKSGLGKTFSRSGVVTQEEFEAAMARWESKLAALEQDLGALSTKVDSLSDSNDQPHPNPQP